MLLPDVNVWLALTFDSHVHHPAAKTWFDGLANDAVCYFCRLTQQGFLRLATNPSAVGKDAVTLPDAWQTYDQFLSDPRVGFAAEPADTEVHWRAFTQSRSFSPKIWNDAYLAAFALAGGLQLVTFDRAFTQFQNVATTVLP
jgi:toxin-antitoxin system PIN domain toxin